MKIKKIGIPQGLLYQYYISLWKPFFEELGFEVVISNSTSKNILDKGVRKMVPEMCAPIKIYAGHVIELSDKADLIYIPRFETISNRDTFCPKFMSLPDLLTSSIPDLNNKILTHSIISDSDDIATPKNYIGLSKILHIDKRTILSALKKARTKWIEYRKLCINKGYNSKQANNKILNGIERKEISYDIKIGVIGYVYDIYDELLSMNVLEKLSELGAGGITFEMFDEKIIQKQLKRFSKKMFWTFSNKTIASAYECFERPEIDGIIHITAFGCGPDAFVGKYLEFDSAKYKKPFMTLRVDEHTGENHLQTRLESFVDMLGKLKSEEVS